MAQAKEHGERPPLSVVVAANVRFERLAQAISQESLARRADVSRETIRRIEAGRLEDGYSMTLDTLGAIARGLGIEAADLLVWKEVATRAFLRAVVPVSDHLTVIENTGRRRKAHAIQAPLLNAVARPTP